MEVQGRTQPGLELARTLGQDGSVVGVQQTGAPPMYATGQTVVAANVSFIRLVLALKQLAGQKSIDPGGAFKPLRVKLTEHCHSAKSSVRNPSPFTMMGHRFATATHAA
jgi:hypothetical protein